jgi:hypothetical protein
VRNKERCPQSCINEKQRDENNTNKIKIGTISRKDIDARLGRRYQSTAIGKIVENICSQALKSLRNR